MKILLIGQGIAGTLLAWALERRGATVALAEAAHADSASRAAAGIINPVTGHRFVRSWRFEEFYPAARDTYRALEQLLGIRCWYDEGMVRVLSTTEDANEWSARLGRSGFSEYLGDSASAGDWAPLLRPGAHYGTVRLAGRVDFPLLLSAFRRRTQQQNRWLDRAVYDTEYEQLLDEYDFVICCEGYRAQLNAWFRHLPWRPSKGEALLIRFHDPRAAAIRALLKKKLLVAPLGDGLFWAGSPYEHHFEDPYPSPAGRRWLLEQLDDTFTASFEIEGHVAGIRPTVADRRPLIGRLPHAPRIGLFNGLGTKGALLAPFWAEAFADHLLNNAPLDPAVDLSRWKNPPVALEREF